MTMHHVTCALTGGFAGQGDDNWSSQRWALQLRALQCRCTQLTHCTHTAARESTAGNSVNLCTSHLQTVSVCPSSRPSFLSCVPAFMYSRGTSGNNYDINNSLKTKSAVIFFYIVLY